MPDFNIKNQTSDHKYFTILQNILSKIELTAFERSVYWALKEAAGENGTCTKSRESLAKAAGMSVPSLKRTLKKLSEINKILNKPLIQIHNRTSKCGDHDTNEIILLDLWNDNMQFFQKKNGGITQTLPRITQTPPRITQTLGVGSHRPPTNNQEEKEPFKESVLFVNAQAREKTENEKQVIVDSLVAKGHTRPDAMAAMSIYEKKQPDLNGTIEKYVEGILTNKKKEKHYAKPNHQRSTAKRNASKRESEQDLIERSRETLRIPSCRGPCDTEQEARGSLDGIYSGPFMRQM